MWDHNNLISTRNPWMSEEIKEIRNFKEILQFRRIRPSRLQSTSSSANLYRQNKGNTAFQPPARMRKSPGASKFLRKSAFFQAKAVFMWYPWKVWKHRKSYFRRKSSCPMISKATCETTQYHISMQSSFQLKSIDKWRILRNSYFHEILEFLRRTPPRLQSTFPPAEYLPACRIHRINKGNTALSASRPG